MSRVLAFSGEFSKGQGVKEKRSMLSHLVKCFDSNASESVDWRLIRHRLALNSDWLVGAVWELLKTTTITTKHPTASNICGRERESDLDFLKLQSHICFNKAKFLNTSLSRDKVVKYMSLDNHSPANHYRHVIEDKQCSHSQSELELL